MYRSTNLIKKVFPNSSEKLLDFLRSNLDKDLKERYCFYIDDEENNNLKDFLGITFNQLLEYPKTPIIFSVDEDETSLVTIRIKVRTPLAYFIKISTTEEAILIYLDK